MTPAYRLEGIFDEPDYAQSPSGLMKCPTCGEHTPDGWQWLLVKRMVTSSQQVPREVSVRDLGDANTELPGPKKAGSFVAVSWMRCANQECDELMVRISERALRFHGGAPLQSEEKWLARPRGGATRPVDPIVAAHYRRDFDEAASILDRSPRMSAVLSRRILADLLEEYAQKAQYNLADRIDSFNEDTTHPRRLRENLHYLREIADLSAHTKKNDQAAIVEVETAEAEWTLEVVERLLDYFIVSAAKDKAVRDEVDQKLKDTGRKPIKPLPEDRR